MWGKNMKPNSLPNCFYYKAIAISAAFKMYRFCLNNI